MENENISEIKIDRRVVKTKRAIRNAFARLLSKKKIDAITIKDIADEADVNRKTIYNYYNGIYEILDEIENELVDSYDLIIQDLDLKIGEDVFTIFERLTTLISKDIDFYGHLLDMDVNSLLVRKIVVSLKTRLKESFVKRDMFPEDKIDIILDYIGAGMLGAYQNWFNKGMKQPIQEFSKDITVLVRQGVQPYLK